VKDDSPFPFRTIKEAWDYFTKAARIHFTKLIKQCIDEDPSIRQKIKTLENRDYCARLLYILNMFAFEGDHEGEFDLDWAMLMAKPMSAAEARKAIHDMIQIGLMGEFDLEYIDDNEDTIPGQLRQDETQKKRTPPRKNGGNTSPNTTFDFDET